MNFIKNTLVLVGTALISSACFAHAPVAEVTGAPVTRLPAANQGGADEGGGVPRPSLSQLVCDGPDIVVIGKLKAFEKNGYGVKAVYRDSSGNESTATSATFHLLTITVSSVLKAHKNAFGSSAIQSGHEISLLVSPQYLKEGNSWNPSPSTEGIWFISPETETYSHAWIADVLALSVVNPSLGVPMPSTNQSNIRSLMSACK